MSQLNLSLQRWPRALESGSAHNSHVLVVDCDVLGVGGLWSEELKAFTQAGGLTLCCTAFAHRHADPVYLSALKNFVDEHSPSQLWVSDDMTEFQVLKSLGPSIKGFSEVGFVPADHIGWEKDLRVLLQAYFPKTLVELGDLKEGVIHPFLVGPSAEDHWLMAERLRHFPMYLKDRFPELPPDLGQMVFWEWSHLELQYVDVGSPRPNRGAGKLGLNQSVRFLEFRNPRFNEPGLWALCVNEEKSVESFNLKPREALAIDLIKEDRAFEPTELAHMLSIYEPLLPMSVREAQTLIGDLLKKEIFYLN